MGKTGENRADAAEVSGKDGGKDTGEVVLSEEFDLKGFPFAPRLMKGAVFTVGVLVSALSIYEVFLGNFQPALQRPLHLFLMGTLTFLLYSSGLFRKKKSRLEGLLNAALIALLFVSTLWAFLNWNPLYVNPRPTDYGLAMGIVCILLVLEATRRSVGLPMAIIGAVFLVYAFVGPWMPRFLAHPGYSLSNVVVHTVVGTEGMMGLLLSISVNQIIFFMMFAAFLMVSNSTSLFMNFSKAIAGSYVGGPAKVAVVSSGLMGMVSGSASGNVATTGSVTIPLMIAMGFKRHIAAAIEAVSSTAGQFMPPIMGASAFIIAEYTGRTYWQICVAAFVPSVLYFVAMFLVVHLQAKKRGIVGLPKSELPPIWPSFRKVLPLLIPLAILVVVLALRFSPQYAILLSLAALVVVCIPIREQRVTVRKLFTGLAMTAKILVPIATSCATAGIVVGIMSLTGLGERLSYGIITIANGNLFVGLLFTACMSIIIGMGLPTLGAYVVMAALGAPALQQLGATPLAAHLFIFYFAILSAITPPVALSAYVGAGIAGANPMKVGYHSMILAPIIYFLPFMFVRNTGLLLEGSFIQIVLDIFEMLCVIVPVCVLSRGYLFGRINLTESLLFLASAAAILLLHKIYLPIGIVLQVVGIVLNRLRFRGGTRAGQPQAA